MPSLLTAAFSTLLGAFAGVTLFVCCCWTSFLIATRIVGHAPASARWCGTAVVAYWLLIASFTGLAALSAFQLRIALPAWLLGAAAAQWLIGRDLHCVEILRSDAARIRSLWSALWRTDLRWLLVGTVALLTVRVLRGLVAPPLAWDALTYHLMKAGHWVQTGGVVPEFLPDGWTCNEYFPYAGDILWAWAMLPVHGDLFVAPASVLVWLTCLLGAYAAARTLGADEFRATLAGLGIALVPAAINYVTSAYVDNTVLAGFLLSVVFLARATDKRNRADTVLAAAALGVLAGVKLNAVPIFAIGCVVVAICVLRNGVPLGQRVRLLAICAIAAAISLQTYVRTWIDTGSPLYPVPVTLLGKEIFAGNPVFVLGSRGQLFNLSGEAAAYFLDALFGLKDAFMGLGQVAPCVLILGVLGAWRLFRRPKSRLIVGFLLLTAAVVTATQMSTVAFWASGSVRYVTSAYAALALPGALIGGRVAELIWLLAIAVGLFYGVLLGWSWADLALVGGLLVALALSVGVVAFVRRVTRRRIAWSVRIVIGLVSAWSMALGVVRSWYRYPCWAAVARGSSFDVHRLNAAYASAWPIWMALDDGAPHRIAVTAGWDGMGTNWYRYPLLGSRLQNTLFYVPPTRDGSLLNYSLEDDPAARGNFPAWIRRLLRSEIEFVVALAPPTIEGRWMRAHPDLFEVVVCSSDGWNCAYRFKRDIAERRPALVRRDERASGRRPS